MKELLSASDACAYAAKLLKINYIPYSPTPLASEIKSSLENIKDNKYDCDIHFLPGNNAALTAAASSIIMGNRTLVFSSLPFDYNEINRLTTTRLPLVIINIAKSTGAMTISHDNDSLKLYEKCLIFMPENNQEIIDSIIQAYEICEDSKVMLPAIINIDDVYFRESVNIPSEQFVLKLMQKPKMRLKDSVGVPLDTTIEKELNVKIALDNSKKVMEKVNEKWKKMKRFMENEKFMTEDAEYVFVIAGINSGTAKSFVKKAREQGEKIGVLRIKILNPWIEKDNEVLSGKKVSVIDTPSGMLSKRINYSVNFITQKRLSEEDFSEMLKKMKSAEKKERIWLV